MSTATSALKLFDLVQSHRVTSVIYVAAKLGLAELLRNGPQSLDELSKRTGANQGALGRLLTALATVGVCSRGSEGQYSLTDIGTALDGFADHSIKSWVIFEGEMLSKAWGGMLESIMTGKTAAQLLGLNNSFELMSRTPENVRIFNAAMADLTRLVTPDILSAYDFSGISHLMDVGGGSGELIGSIVREYAQIRGTVFDLPRCAETANSHLERVGVRDRAGFVAGDFFQTIPAVADGIILKSVIHDWNDERSSVILRKCRRALPEQGKLILVERVMPASPTSIDQDRAHAMSDLNMLRGPGGLERTETQYRHLLTENGFRPGSIYSAGLFSVIEAGVG